MSNISKHSFTLAASASAVSIMTLAQITASAALPVDRQPRTWCDCPVAQISSMRPSSEDGDVTSILSHLESTKANHALVYNVADTQVTDAVMLEQPDLMTAGAVNDQSSDCDSSDSRFFQEMRLLDYLAKGSTKSVSLHTVKMALNVWSALDDVTDETMPVPGCDFGGEQQVLLIWNRGDHHLDAEVFDDGNVEFFYRNRRTGHIWSYDWNYTEDSVVPDEVASYSWLV